MVLGRGNWRIWLGKSSKERTKGSESYFITPRLLPEGLEFLHVFEWGSGGGVTMI